MTTKRTHDVAFAVSSNSRDISGPILASFPGLSPPIDTQFKCYRDIGDCRADVAFAKQKTYLAGETETVDFCSINPLDEAEKIGYFSEYLIAVYNKRTNTVTLRPAPLYIMSRGVKRFKALRAEPTSIPGRLQARSILGQTFGSKRSRAAIQAAERNRVDISAMGGVAHHMQDSIDMNTVGLPTQVEMEGILNSSRPGPPCHMNAVEASAAYPVQEIVPESELAAFSVKMLLSASSDAQRLSLLPYNRSKWINSRITFLCQHKKPEKIKLRMLYYIACMLCFREVMVRKGNREKLAERMAGVPQVVQEGLTARFAEDSKDFEFAQVTSEMEVKLLAYMFALCLHVDDFAVDIGVLADDLHMPLAKVGKLFKALGCKVEVPNNADRERLGLPKDGPAAKRALLRIPLSFPKQRIRKARRQRPG